MVGPISAFVGVVVTQAINVSDQAIPWVQQHFGSASTFNAHDWLVQRFPTLAPYVPDQAQILEGLGRTAKAAGAYLVVSATQLTAGTAGFFLNFFVMLYSMFFLSGRPKVVPGIGPAVVWLPAVIYLFLTGQTLSGVLLIAWCGGVVGTVDNVLRPLLFGKDAEMPDLLILIGTLGGLFLFGPIGFIVGPIVCGLFLTVWEIYGTTFREILPPVRSLRSGKLTREE